LKCFERFWNVLKGFGKVSKVSKGLVWFVGFGGGMERFVN
jgi:hypothetical protein